jgi:galactose oxidase
MRVSTSSRHFYGSAPLCLLALLSLFGQVHAASGAPTEIVSASSGLCMQISGASQSSGAAVIQFPCSGAADQLWSLVPYQNYYHLVVQHSGQCLNVTGDSKLVGAALIQWPCQTNGQTNDQWSVVSVGTNYHLVNVNSGQCAIVAGNSQTPGTGLIQSPCQPGQPSGQDDQWSLSVASTPALPSAWSGVIPLPVTPIAVANLPNGKLLIWSAGGQYSFSGDIGNAYGQTYTGVFDPATDSSTEVLVTWTGADMFCPGTAVLPDGRVLINGGTSSPKTTLYQPSTNSWSIGAEMHVPRGYEGDTVLSNGAVLTLGGSWSGGVGGKTGEVWTPNTGWTLMPGIPETNVIGPDPQGIYRGDNHLWLFAVGNGAVFHAGPSAQMNWITTAGSGSIRSAGNRGNDPYSINGNAAMYDVGKILKVGGAPAYQQQSSGTIYATNFAYLIDITAGVNGSVNVTQLAPMNYQRAFSNSVILPNGNVVVVGGQSIPQPFTDTAAILVPEIWNPATQKFSMLKPMQTPRTYHSTAILLSDGRVFVGGGGQCGSGCAQNHLNAEILTPPYLLNADGSAATRPVIVAASPSAALGGTLAVTTQAPVASFVLMRLSAVTHTVNNDQRRIPLTIAATNGPASFVLAIPSDRGVALPGNYMLFALNSNGVPSVSTTVNIH